MVYYFMLINEAFILKEFSLQGTAVVCRTTSKPLFTERRLSLLN